MLKSDNCYQKLDSFPAKYICKTGLIGHTVQCSQCDYHVITDQE